jgi:16S rRNA (guanine527-N7)-methyltransferase
VKPLEPSAEVREALHALSPSADLDRLELFAGWLAGPGVERGLIGPREVDRLWSRHLVNCALVLPLLPESGSICDLGSGAGLPGVVVALMRPTLSMVLLEPVLRRVVFLQEVTAALSLAQVSVVRARAEDYGREAPGHDVVLARAVAPLPRLARWAGPLLRPGGQLIALKGQNAAEELRQARLDRTGFVASEICRLAQGGNVTHAVRAVRRPEPRRATEDR